MTLKLLKSCLAILTLAWTLPAGAASIPVPNGDFESTGSRDVNNNGHWSSENPGGTFPGPGISDEFDNNDEFWSAGSGNDLWGTGWSALDAFGGQGLNHPNWNMFRHNTDSPPNTLNNLFGGYFVGHLNVQAANTDPPTRSDVRATQSSVLGQLQPGVYKAQVAIGYKFNQNWQDLEFRLGLVAAATADGSFGSTGGTIIGEAVTVMQRTENASLDSNERWLQLTVAVEADHPNLGQNIAIRLGGRNTGMVNGAAGDAQQFSQVNYDNVTLELVPEPGTLGLAAGGLVALIARRRRVV
jgi:hypothetical protein